MEYISRSCDGPLSAWKEDQARKVLLIRGARQVGKTWAVRNLAASFPSYLEVNFLQNPEINSFFEAPPRDPLTIIEKLGAYFGKSVRPGETLLFLDEIQSCPAAIEALRFFAEKLPKLHLIAAGSLLEFSLAKLPSFGVGRITSLFMHPLSFYEFLTALKLKGLVDLVRTSTPAKPIDAVLHAKILDHLKTYMIIGGLPEIVATYIRARDLNSCSQMLGSLLVSYEDDFVKYRDRANTRMLRDVLRSVAQQVGQKFMYSRVASEEPTHGFKEALALLERAGLIHKVYHSHANGIPLGAESDLRRFKTLPLDIGIYNRLLGLDLRKLVAIDPAKLITAGSAAELLVGQELIAHGDPFVRPDLFYWHRQSPSSNAEVDYLIQNEQNILPIEVKAGTKGQMQSLHRFMEEKGSTKGIRVSSENFGSYGQILVVPLYAVAEIPRLLAE